MYQPNRRRALVVAVLATTAPAVAATVDWRPTAPSPATSSDPANWSTGFAPTSADAARFATGTAHTVTLTDDTTTNQFLVANDELTLDLAGRTYTVGSVDYYVPGLAIGSASGSSVTLANSSTTLGLLSVFTAVTSPNAGDTSSLNITAGATLGVFRTENTSPSLVFGKAGAAFVSISDGGTLDVTRGSTTLAQDPGSSANITVTGPSARWIIGSTTVGGRGNAAVSVSGGAALRSGGLIYTLGDDSVARTASGSITLDGAGTQFYGLWETQGTTAGTTISVGNRSPGSLTIRNGASAVLGTVNIATYAGATGTISLQDPTSSFSAGSVAVGGSSSAAGGAGTLTISAGTAKVSGTLKLHNTPNSSLNLTGGTLSAGVLDLAASVANLHWTGGTLELTNSAFQVSNPTTVSPALNYISNAGHTVSLTAGMSLKISTKSTYTHYLVVDNGGALSATTASILADDSVWVGYASTGSLSLSDQASLSTGWELHIGHRYLSSSGSTLFGDGTVTLDRGSSLTTAGAIYVGSGGAGKLSIGSGSSVSSSNAFVAYGSLAASATVDGPGSSWTTTGTLTIGKVGQGTLTISNGATVSTAGASIGNTNLEPTSSATIQGPGSSWSNAGTLYVARGTGSTFPVNASLSLLDHASLSTNYLLAATTSSRANAALSLSSGSALTVVTSAYLGGNATIAAGTATLSLTDSSATVGNTLKLHNTPNTSLALTRSALTVGTPAAPGSLDNAAAISLADHSTLTLHGTLANAGTVSLSRDSLLLWDPTSTPDPLATLRAQLATGHILPSPAAPTNYRPAYTLSGEPTAPTSITITLALTGDTNLDGRIDPDDYALLDRAFARSTADAHWTDGDFNYDGIINNQDYLLIDTAYGHAQGLSPQFLSLRESQFGATYVAALLTSVPEPSSLACLFAGSLLLPRRRRR